MDFQLTLEQEMLKDSVSAALDAVAGPNAGLATWGEVLADLGVLGIFVPETLGGSELGAVEASLVVAEAGQRTVRFPVAETIAALPLLAKTHPDAVAAILSGVDCITAPCSGLVALTAGRLRGAVVAPYAAQVKWLAVNLDDGRSTVVALAACTVTKRAMLDEAAPNFDVAIDLVVEPGMLIDGADLADRIVLLRTAEMTGAARHCFGLTVQYLKDRSQFGRPIGSNQSLKHVAADNFVRLESMRVALEFAASALDASRARPADDEARNEADTALQVLLAYAPDAARTLAEDAVQLHGGIGATWDYQLNAYLRRILRLAAALGATDGHRQALADRVLLDAGASIPLSAAAE